MCVLLFCGITKERVNKKIATRRQESSCTTDVTEANFGSYRNLLARSGDELKTSNSDSRVSSSNSIESSNCVNSQKEKNSTPNFTDGRKSSSLNSNINNPN